MSQQEAEVREPTPAPAKKAAKRKARKVDLNKMRAARLEKLGPGPTVEFGDVTFQCPAEVPFAVIEAFASLEAADESKDGEKAIVSLKDAVRGMLGDQFDAFMAQNPATEDMAGLIEIAFAEYGVDLGELSASPDS